MSLSRAARPASKPVSIVACVLAGVAALAAGPHAGAAPPEVPATLSYQGLLLTPQGEPRTGSVPLTLRIYDALLGGTLVYKQGYSSVPLADGVFSVQLGPTGDATDAPANPLTTSLATALAGDAGPTAPARFLEVTVGAEGPLSRTQILSSAYALRATSAASADTAASAAEATQVGGIPSAFVTQLWEHGNLDGTGPLNSDPAEGLADVDADGVASFLDADNDGDGIQDGTELQQGTGMNLVTPVVTALTPNEGYYSAVTLVTIQGSNFQPGATVEFGTQSPAPTNVTPTSLQVQVGPQTPGAVTPRVALPNGEISRSGPGFRFQTVLPPAHAVPLASFLASLDVQPGSPDLALGGVDQYGTGPNAAVLSPLESAGANGDLAVAFDPTGRLEGLRCRTVSGSACAVELLSDADGDRLLEDETPIPIQSIPGTSPFLGVATLDHDANGRRVVGYVARGVPSFAAVARDRDGDGDFDGAGEQVAIENNAGAAFAGGALALDSADRVAFVYYHGSLGAIRVAWDRSGDGDFADTVAGSPELFTLATPTPTCLAAAFDASDRLVVAYKDLAVSAPLRLARDANGDGDFADAGEDVAIAGETAGACDLAHEAGQPLVLATAGDGNVELRLDRNGDGDFDDADELLDFTSNDGGGSPVVKVALDGGSAAVVAVQGFLHFALTD